jgi:type II secretory pathway component GspD/PulD (secretin)
MNAMKFLLSLLTVLTLLLGYSPDTGAETRIFDLKYRRADDLVEVVRSVIDVNAKVAAVNRSLVVSASSQDISAVDELIRRFDHPLRMLRVTVGQDHAQVERGTSLGASGQVSGGDATVVIGRPDVSARAGATVIVDGDDRLRVGANLSEYRQSRTAEQFIVTLEGSPALISVGKNIPFTERWLVLARRHAQIVENVRYQSIDTGFEVEPELSGDVVQLKIRPFMAFHDPRQPLDIRFQELTTTVNVPLGQWLDLGRSVSGNDEVSREILAVGNITGKEYGSVRVRVELQPE